MPGGHNPRGVLGTGALIAECASTVLVAPTATDTTNSATNVIFLSMEAPYGLVVECWSTRRVTARLANIHEQPGDQCLEP